MQLVNAGSSFGSNSFVTNSACTGRSRKFSCVQQTTITRFCFRLSGFICTDQVEMPEFLRELGDLLLLGLLFGLGLDQPLEVGALDHRLQQRVALYT